jgi:glycosyltransferase involved in cell wall biosynthesis
MINSNLFGRDSPSNLEEPKLPSASIIVPVWNGEKLLPSCLDSLMKQDFDLPEIIIVDDGSTDRSLQVAKNALGGRPNVRIISHPKNLGLSRTLNEGIKEAKGEFVQIVHQDCEIIDSNYLTKAVESIESNPRIAAVTGRRVYQLDKFSDNEKLFMAANGHLAEMSTDASEPEDVTFTEHKCDLFRKDVVESIGGFPDARFRTSGEDQVLSSELRNRGYRLVRLGSIRYNLGFGNSESTVKGILRKVFVYGKTQAGVLAGQRRSSLKGISNNKTLSSRAMNRLEMLLATFAIVLGLALSLVSPLFILVSFAALILRILGYANRLGKIRGRIRLALLGPIMDAIYSIGFLDGLLVSATGRQL